MNATDQVRSLLKPTDDLNSWYTRVIALNVKEATPILIGVLQSEVEPLRARRQAVTMLGLLGAEDAIPQLVETLTVPERLLRAGAAEALGRLVNTTKAQQQHLIRGLQDPDYFVRESCAKALAALKSTEALSELAHMRDNDPVSSNREVALAAIQAIQGTK